jgi:plastocyanin
MSRNNRHRTPAVVVAGVAVLLAGCGGTDTAGNAGTSTPPAETPPAETSSGEMSMNGMQMAVSLTDFKVELAEQTMTPGTHMLDVTNDGEAPHALTIEGQGVNETGKTLEAGQQEMLSVDLPAGTYTFYCPVGDHRAQGMETTITVTG